MLAVSVTPLALFSAAGITALSGLNHGALSTADRQLVASQSLHLADLVQSKATIVNDELASIEDQIGLLGLETGGALANSGVTPNPQTATTNAIILGPGAAATTPTEQVLALQSLENSASTIAQLHPEVAEVWLQLPGSGLLEVSLAAPSPRRTGPVSSSSCLPRASTNWEFRRRTPQTRRELGGSWCHHLPSRPTGLPSMPIPWPVDRP